VVTTTEVTKEAPTNQKNTPKKVTLGTLQRLPDTIEDIPQNQLMEDTLQRPPVTPEGTLQRPPVTPEGTLQRPPDTTEDILQNQPMEVTPQKPPVTQEDILQNQLTEVTVKRGVTPEVTAQNRPVTTVTGDVTKMYLKKEGRSQTCFPVFVSN